MKITIDDLCVKKRRRGHRARRYECRTCGISVYDIQLVPLMKAKLLPWNGKISIEQLSIVHYKLDHQFELEVIKSAKKGRKE